VRNFDLSVLWYNILNYTLAIEVNIHIAFHDSAPQFLVDIDGFSLTGINNN
jgi:hypothetical protein